MTFVTYKKNQKDQNVFECSHSWKAGTTKEHM